LKKDYFVFQKIPSQNKFFHSIEIFFRLFILWQILFLLSSFGSQKSRLELLTLGGPTIEKQIVLKKFGEQWVQCCYWLICVSAEMATHWPAEMFLEVFNF